MQKEKKVKIIVIFISFVISLLFIFIVFLLNKDDNLVNSVQKQNIIFEKVTDYNIFFSVETNINKYINAIIEQNYDKIYEILHSNYSSNGDNLINIPNYEPDTKFKAYEMKNHELNKNVIVYYTKGNIINNSYDYNILLETNVQFLIFIDYNNRTVSVYPLKENENYESIIKGIDLNYSIEKNSYNDLEGISIISTNSICLMYLSDYISRVSADLNDAYYITTNFSDINEFEIYLKNHELSSVMKSCGKNSGIYTVTDDNGNSYKFLEESIMNYTVSISD